MKTVLMTSCVGTAESAGTVSAVTATTVPSADCAKTVSSRYATAATAARNVQRYALIATKNVQTVQTKRFAVVVTLARTA